MPLLDIAVAQSSFQNYLGYPRVQLLINGKGPTYSLLQHEERWVSFQKSFHNPGNLNFNLGHCKKRYPKFLIKAIATLEQKRSVQSKDGENESHIFPSTVESVSSIDDLKSSSGDAEDVDERERLRRIRISKANKGNTPWNKGRKHSAETRQRIRERTKLAMQNPKVKMKLANIGHAQSEETREKIAIGVRIGWQRRREKLLVQENCLYDWQNLIAEAARTGFHDEEELQWDSYKILNEQLQKEWLESIEHRKTMPRPKGSKRAPKSLEQRRKIAEAIAAKWADPEYRSKVCSSLAKYHGIEEGAERKPRRKPKGDGQSTRIRAPRSAQNEIKVRPPPKLKKRAPKYKDPLASTKLEMLKSIRAQRVASDTVKNEAVQRAKLLIAEAEKAAEALEVAATRSPVAQASLLETRKLIAEAIQSIESVENGELTSEDDVASGPQDYFEKNEEAVTEDANQNYQQGVNGIASLQSSEGHNQDFNLNNPTMLDELEMNHHPPSSLHRYELPKVHLESFIEKSDSRKLRDQHHHPEPNGAIRLNGISLSSGAKLHGISSSYGAKLHIHEEQIPAAEKSVTKKWVRGRLVEVGEGE